MNLYTLALYVNLDVDDSFDEIEITRWFNKGISQYNLIPPLTKYPYALVTDEDSEDENNYYTTDYPLDQTFMLGIMLPFINSAIRGQDASVQEKQIYLEEFLNNAKLFKTNNPIEEDYLFDTAAAELDIYRLGENVYISDMRYAPFSNEWTKSATFNEVKTDADVDDSTFSVTQTIVYNEE